MKSDMWEDIAAQSKLEPATTNDYLIYQQFRTIFADTNLDGKYAQSSHYRELHKSNPLVAGDVLQKTLDFLEQNVSSSKDISDRKRKCLSEASSASERSGWSQELSNAMAGAILDMINCSTLQEVAKPVIDEGFSISNCKKALDKIEGIDNHLYYAALELFENLTFREEFISLEGNYGRLMWLQEKCGLINASS